MRIAPDDLARGWERSDNGLGMAFCWCPPGTFSMGRLPDPLARFQDAAPVSVTLRRGVWMGKFEVTQSQWLRVMGATLRQQRAKDPDQPRPVGDGSTRDHVGEGPGHPIYFVSHAEAEAFCRRLGESERAANRPGEYRLPTEAEWEFACRAGSTAATAFGDRLDGTQANFDGTKPFNGARPAPTSARRPPSAATRPTPGASTTCTATSGSGASTASRRPSPAAPTRSGRPPPRAGRIAAAAGTTPAPSACRPRRASGEPDDRGSGLGFRVALVAPGP